MRILTGTDITITSPVFVGADGESPANTTGVPTVAVATADGAALDAPTAELLDGEVGLYTVKLTAAEHTTRIDQLTVTWSGTAEGHAQALPQTVDVVDGHYATLAELRAIPDLEDEVRFPSWLLAEARDSYAELIEQARGASWVGVLRTEALRWRSPLILGRPWVRELRSITLEGEPIDLDTVTATLPAGTVDLTHVTTRPCVAYPTAQVAFVHGATGVPGGLRRACREYVRAMLLADTGGIARNALSWSDNQGGTYRTSTADWAAGRFTGLMSVDQEINAQPDYRIPGIA